MKVLVTGFEPFGGESVNPALEAVRRLPDIIAGAQVVTAELPVAFGRDVEVLREAVAEHVPDVCVCVGQAGGRPSVTPEFVGINYIHAPIPDNDGKQPIAQQVIEGAPAAYFSSLPVHAIAGRMGESGIPAAVSYSAGTFCCNEVLYALMHLCATDYPQMRGGFIHVPYTPEQAARKDADVPSLPIDTAVRALSIALETCVEIPLGDIADAASGTEQ